MSEPKKWQNAINPQLEKRLIRPLSQPGVINFDMATKVLLRSQQFNHRNPLLKNPRWSTKKNLNTNKIPIVYAQPSINNQKENSVAISPDTSGKFPSSPIQTKAEKINSVPPIKSSISQPIIQRKIDTSSSSNVTSLSNTDERDSSQLPLVEPELNHPKSAISQKSVISQSSNQENVNKINATQVNELLTAQPSELPLVKPELNHPESIISQPSHQEDTNQENVNKINATQVNESPTAQPSELPLVKLELNHPESIISQPSHQGDTNQENVNKINATQVNELLTAQPSELPLVKPELNHPESTISQPSHQGDTNQRNVTQRNESPTVKPSELPLVTIEMSTFEKQRESTDKSNLPIIHPHKMTNISLLQENYRDKQLQSNTVSSNNQQNNNIPLVKPQNNVNIYSSSSPKEPSVVLEIPTQQTQQNLTSLVFTQANSQRTSESVVDPNAYQQIQQHNNNQNSPNSSQTSPTVVNQWLINNQSSQKPENNQPKIDINAITNQVERNLKRKFMVESERRGYKKWR